MKNHKTIILAWIIMVSLVFQGLGSIVQAQSRAKSVVQKRQMKAVPETAGKLPDLIVSHIKLIKDCKIQITIKNIGTAGVPDSGYDLNKGAGIQMLKGGKAWGGIRLGAIDRSGFLKVPGGAVKHVWFPKAKNLELGCGTHSIKVIVDNNNAVKELNEKNNSKTVRLTCKEGCDKKAKGAIQRKTSGIPTGVKQNAPMEMQSAGLSSMQTAQLISPDLVLSNFDVNQAARQQVNNAFDYPFTVRIRNVGTGDVKNAYDLSFQTYNGGWSGENQPGFNCIRINKLLKAGESYLYSGTLRLLNYQISEQDLRVRAFVDAGCSDEFSKPWGHVGESDENNNHSNEVTIVGDYHPNIGSVTPNVCIRGADQAIMLGGMGFGSTQGTHTVLLRKGTTKIAANVTGWNNGVIYFKVPAGAALGLNKVSIADAATLQKYPTANEVDLLVQDTKVLTWTNLIDVWDLFNEAFEINLNTHGGGASYNNTSNMRLIQSTAIDVPLIQFNYAGLKYRFLVKDMNSQPGGIILTRQGCGPNQLKMEVSFESAGIELKGFNRALIKGANWCDGCVADVHINNGKMVVVFNFSATNGNLDFDLDTSFSASVSASNAFADALMNLFLGNWNQDVRDQINDGVKAGLTNPANKSYILSEFENLIKLLLALNGKQITDIGFENDGIHVTYTE